MELDQIGPGNRICTVVFVDLVQYSQLPVSEQVEVKGWFNELLGHALEHTALADRVVLDTGDGAALCFLGDPEDALFAANSLRAGVVAHAAARNLRLRLGINLGPVRIVKDINGHTNVIGDGINVAQRVMSFAEPNRILVSRSYYEVVSRLSQEYAQLFQYAGLHRDKHIREHEVYEVHLALGPGGATAAGPAGAEAAGADRPAEASGPGQAARFDAALLDRLSAALAREIGPVAKLIVRRAAERAGSLEGLVTSIAESVAEASRPAFLVSLGAVVGSAAGEAGAAAARKVAPSGSGAVAPDSRRAPSGGPPREIGPELLARAEQILTRHLGPIARILVKNAAKRAQSPRELFESLAVHIENADVRQAFLGESDRSV